MRLVRLPLGLFVNRPITNTVTVETVAFAVSVLVVTYTVQDGKSNYLEGAMLLGLYIIIAVAFYSVPSGVIDESFTNSLN